MPANGSREILPGSCPRSPGDGKLDAAPHAHGATTIGTEVFVCANRCAKRDFLGCRSCVVVTFTFACNGSGAAKGIVTPCRQPLQSLRLGEQHSPEAALNLAFRNHLREARKN
jgi:hypothetical protein